MSVKYLKEAKYRYTQMVTKILVEFIKSGQKKRKITVSLGGDHEICDTIYEDLKTRMTQLGWELNS